MIRSKQIAWRQKVLVVDDQELNRDILESILEEDFDILFAENGKEAMEIIEANREELSLVLLDLIMPVMTGFEVLEAMKQDEELRQIPIIVLTSEKEAELQALELGAADFITKPFDLHEVILARVNRIIELSEGRKLILAAEHDKLTGVYSRNFFFEYANRLHQYHPDMHFDAIVLNIEQFHTVNALNGRDFGNEVLRTIGHAINNYLQGANGISGRIEADYFDIFLETQEDYQAMLAHFQSKVNEISPNVNIHLRMGVMPWQEGLEPVVMFDRARAACNLVRGNYQKPLMVYDETMRSKEMLRQRLLNDLRTAIDEHQFLVYYQPKYDIQAEPPRLTSAEALVRWKHPELGMISPGDFIPLFEGNGLISLVDRFVWEKAAQQIAAWRDQYGFQLPVSVNLSRADMFDPHLADRFIELVESNHLDYNSLKLEVTESAYTDNAGKMIRVIDELREKGFEIEMDDFGSGYSSLNMLSEMPMDVLKMDMKFIRNIENNETDRRLVSLILDIAKYLKVSVVAEGVETEGQLAILKEGKCDYVQGYYFSKPLPPGEFESLIQKELETERK